MNHLPDEPEVPDEPSVPFRAINSQKAGEVSGWLLVLLPCIEM